MSAADDIFSPSDDFQKAKRNCFIASILGIVLSNAQKNEGATTIKLFDINLNGPLWLFVAISLIAILYSAYSYYIHERREHVNHSQLVRQFGDRTLSDAVKRIKPAILIIEEQISESTNFLASIKPENLIT